jgi:metal-sulfur cluster biosynthetic enzyme
MTLTAPNCPYGDEIIDGVDYACRRIDDVNEVFINLTFDPPWNPEKISDAAKYFMGIL